MVSTASDAFLSRILIHDGTAESPARLLMEGTRKPGNDCPKSYSFPKPQILNPTGYTDYICGCLIVKKS
jgi:hypothetical protein